MVNVNVVTNMEIMIKKTDSNFPSEKLSKSTSQKTWKRSEL